MVGPLNDYELVILGTPVWAWSVTSPVRTFLIDHADDLPRVAFFATCGSSGMERTFAQMRAIAKQLPVAQIGFNQQQIGTAAYAAALSRFVYDVQGIDADESPPDIARNEESEDGIL